MSTDAYLAKTLYIKLLVIPKPFRNSYAGTGVRRRREKYAEYHLAEFLADHLKINYVFYDGDTAQSRDDVKKSIEQRLTTITDDIAKASGSKISDISNPALEEIANLIAADLIGKWRYDFIDRNQFSGGKEPDRNQG